MLYEWPVSLLQGQQSVRLTRQGIGIGDAIHPWSTLKEVGFVRYQTRGGVNEELVLMFAENKKRTLQWTGIGRKRAPWREMLVAFAQIAGRERPDLDVRDGPDAHDLRVARRIALGVVCVALVMMGIAFIAAESIWGWLAGFAMGLGGSSVGASIYKYYSRPEDAPRLSWEGFAAREGREGELPAN